MAKAKSKAKAKGESKPPGSNRIFYPLHPARNAQCKEKGWYWEGHPERELGNHDGLTDKLREAPLDP